jgi:hypothetical protein
VAVASAEFDEGIKLDVGDHAGARFFFVALYADTGIIAYDSLSTCPVECSLQE